MVIVSNSSPLILLSRVGLFHFLRKLLAKIYIPKQVYEEVVTAGKGRPGSKEVRETSWVKIEEVKDQDSIEQFEVKNLSRKDAAVIVLVKQKKADAVLMDEKRGREVCKTAAINPIGTGALLVRAKVKELIPDVKTYLDKLVKDEFRISQEHFKTFHSCKPKEEKLGTVIKYCNKGA